MNSTEHMKIAAFQELQEALKVKRVNDELLEFLASSLGWILRYAKKNNMEIPDKEKIIEIMNRAMVIENKYQLSTESQHQNKTTEDSTKS
jgi:hypothetical protein